jgi:hypothetical protein
VVEALGSHLGSGTGRPSGGVDAVVVEDRRIGERGRAGTAGGDLDCDAPLPGVPVR